MEEPTATRRESGHARGGRIRRAFGLSLLNTIVGRLATFVTGVVLARLLAPEDFGVFAVALVTLNGVLAINEMGVSIALVRWKGDPRRIAPTVTTISIVSSVALYVLCWLIAPSLSRALGAPEATGVVRLLCVGVLIDGLTAAAVQLVNREFRQGVRLGVDLFNLSLTTAVTVLLAVNDQGAWSLAWGRLVGNAISALLLFRLVSMWPRPGFNRVQAGELLRFGLPLAGASLLLFAMLNIDFVVAGNLLGAVALGLYLQAFNLSSWPVNMFSVVVRRVSLAAFANAGDDDALREARLVRLCTLLGVVTLPVCLLLGLLAGPLVVSLYGAPWRGAADALQFLAILGCVRVFGELSYDYLVAVGGTTRTMLVQGIWLGALVLVLPVGALLDGIRGVAAGHALVAVLVIVPLYLWSIRRTGVRLGNLGRPLARPLVGCLLMAAIIAIVKWQWPTDLGWIGLLVAGGAAGAVYVISVWPLRRLLLQSTTP